MPWIVDASMNRPSSSLFVAGVLGLVGCGGTTAPPPEEVRARIANDLVAVSDTAEASRANGASLPDTTQFALLQGAFSGVLDTDLLGVSSEISARVAPRMANLVAPEDSAEEDPYDGAAAAQWLNENVFTDANHAGDGIYKVPASLACDSTAEVDPGCVQAFDRLQLRVRVSENDELLKFALQIGPNHDEPLELGLSATLLSLTIDLDEAEDAAKALLPKGEQAPSFSLSGEVTAKLEVLGAAAAKLSLDIDRDVAVSFEDTTFSSKKAHVLALTLDGGAKSMELALGLGETKAHVPSEIDGTIDLDLPGITAVASYTEGQPLVISNLGLGARTTKLQIDGQTALAVDLNPNDGRKLDAQIAGDTLTVSPRLDFRTQVNHAVLGDDAPVYDVTRVALDGGLRSRADESVEVITGGSLTIETNPASYGVAATAGECVRGTETYDAARGTYYTALSTGTCN